MMRLIAITLLLAGCAHAPPTLVAPGVYRSGQPSRVELQRYRSDIKLDLGADPAPSGVRVYAEDWAPAGPVSHEQIAAALWDLTHASRPTLIHCTHGVDRTGLLVALYRVEVQGWTPARAWAEWREFGRDMRLVWLSDAFERETGWRP